MNHILADFHIHLESNMRLQVNQDIPQYFFSITNAEPEINFVSAFINCVQDLTVIGCSYAEVRYNPLTWAKKRNVSLERQPLLLSSLREWARTERQFVLCPVITLKRNATSAEIDEVESFAITCTKGGSIAVDVSRSYVLSQGLAGEVCDQSLRALGPICHKLGSHGLNIYAHTGWYDTINDVWDAIDILGAKRIGHGLAIGKDRSLWHRLARDNIIIEICPSAAYILGGVATGQHPWTEWAKAGIRLLLGSDHPIELGTSIAKEAACLNMINPSLADVVLAAGAVIVAAR